MNINLGFFRALKTNHVSSLQDSNFSLAQHDLAVSFSAACLLLYVWHASLANSTASSVPRAPCSNR